MTADTGQLSSPEDPPAPRSGTTSYQQLPPAEPAPVAVTEAAPVPAPGAPAVAAPEGYAVPAPAVPLDGAPVVSGEAGGVPPAWGVVAGAEPDGMPPGGYGPPVFPVAAPAPARPKRRIGRWLVGIAAVLALLLGVAGAVLVFDPYGVAGTTTTRAFETVDRRKAFLSRVQKVFDARAKALLDGDEKGWLAAVDPQEKKLVDSQRRIFRTLREMEISRYVYDVRMRSADNFTAARLTVGYCFGAEDCDLLAESEAMISVREDDRGLSVTDYEPRGMVRPWEVSDLEVEVGRRVIILAQPKYAHRLGTYRKLADRAAVHADRFGPRKATSGKHVVFFAGPGGEADKWYEEGVGEIKYASSYDLWSDDESQLRAVESVVRPGQLKGPELRFQIDWHMGYAAVATGTVESLNASWWLPSGVATYLGQARDNPALYDIAGEIRAYRGAWSGALDEFYPRGDNFGEWQTASWCVVHRLISKYGEKRFAAFLDAVLREGDPYTTAAKKHLGTSLDAVESDIKSYLRGLA